MTTTSNEVESLAAALRERGVEEPELFIVLGSGLGSFAERLTDSTGIPFDDLEAMPPAAVPGHAGRFVSGRLGGTPLLLQLGRAHFYEGRSASEVTRSVRAVLALGCGKVLLTNAAGGIHADWPPGTLMRVRDHMNLQGVAPLELSERCSGALYDEALARALDEAARERGLELRSGVYAGVMGPAYETAAEIRLLRDLGADAVGMSTVAEAAAARALGARVATVSLITNHATGVADGAPDHEEVLRAGAQAAQRFGDLLEAAVPHLVGA